MAKAVKTTSQKIECFNPNTGNSMFIDADIYKLFQKAIYHTLKATSGIPFSDIVKGIKKCFKEDKVKFTKSVSWYAVTVKMDMEVKKVIEAYTEKGVKLHHLKK
jgi:hypothetical protein